MSMPEPGDPGERMDLTIGSLVSQRYRILQELGRGGMSTVFLARDEHFPHIQRLCAVKMMRASPDPPLAALQQTAFEREAALLATLRHPAIPQIYDFFVVDTICVLVLEFVEGQNLEQLLLQRGEPFPESNLLDWALQILDVLQYLHSQRPHPIIFRDMKPSNIMCRKDGRLSLIDFEIARLFQPHSRATMIGTDGYAPPEQYRGISDPRSDLYALRATLYQLATGVDPRDEPPFSLVNRPPRVMNPSLSPEFEQIILKALAYAPEQRYPSAASMMHALRTLANQQAAHLPHTAPSTSAPNPLAP